MQGTDLAHTGIEWEPCVRAGFHRCQLRNENDGDMGGGQDDGAARMTPVFVEGLGEIGTPLPRLQAPVNPAPEAAARGTGTGAPEDRGPESPAEVCDYAVSPADPAAAPGEIEFLLLNRALNAPGRRLSKLEGGAVLAAETALGLMDLIELQDGYLGLLEARLPTESDSLEALEEARRLARRVRSSVERILSEMRDGIADMEYLELTAVMAGVIPALVREAGEDVRLRIAPGSGPIPLRGNPYALQRALVHLVRNAREASPGGSEVRVSWGQSESSAASERGVPWQPGFARVRVEDRGNGIPSRFLPWIFKPFFSLHDTASGGHTGLGLPVVRSVVEGHGGWVEVTSTAGSGTVVDLFLPLQVPAVQHEPPPHSAVGSQTEGGARPQPDGVRSEPEKGRSEPEGIRGESEGFPREHEELDMEPDEVLIVEEDRLLSGLVEKVLSAEGYRVRVVRVEGGRAAAEASDASPSLLMVERTLPGGRAGEEFLAPWRERFPRARVLLLDWSEAGPVARHEGEPPVLRRPFEPARILSAVEKAIELVLPPAGEEARDPTSKGRPH